MVGVDAWWTVEPIYQNNDGLFYTLPDGVTLTCFGGASSVGEGCGDERSLIATNPFNSLKSYSIDSYGGFTLTNNSDQTFNANDGTNSVGVDTFFTDFNPGSLGAAVTDPKREDASFFSSVAGSVHYCDTRSGVGENTFFDSSGGLYRCSVESPDFSEEDFFPVIPELTPGDSYSAYYEISIQAELQGDLPEPSSFPLFATGLGLLAWLAGRRRISVGGQ
jgi:hypothetical protein